MCDLICGGVLEDLRCRVRLYANLHRRLAHRTRFFSAAAATNAVLVELFSKAAVRLWLEPCTSGFLLSVGRTLEEFNTRAALRLERDVTRESGLDDKMVAIEQSAVETMLRHLALTDAVGHAVTVVQMNRLLRLAGPFYPASWLGSEVRSAYGRVLQSVARELGRPISFALQEDRESIGRALIRSLPASMEFRPYWQ